MLFLVSGVSIAQDEGFVIKLVVKSGWNPNLRRYKQRRGLLGFPQYSFRSVQFDFVSGSDDRGHIIDISPNIKIRQFDVGNVRYCNVIEFVW